jgi:hypothetical protein
MLSWAKWIQSTSSNRFSKIRFNIISYFHFDLLSSIFLTGDPARILAPRHEDVWGSGNTSPRILNLGNRWRRLVGFIPRQLFRTTMPSASRYEPGCAPGSLYTLIRTEKSLVSVRIEPRFPGYPGHKLLTGIRNTTFIFSYLPCLLHAPIFILFCFIVL